MTRTITIPAPAIATGPSAGAFPHQDAAAYLVEVSRTFARDRSHGSGVRELVGSLLSDVVRAVREVQPATPVGNVVAEGRSALEAMDAALLAMSRPGASLPAMVAVADAAADVVDPMRRLLYPGTTPVAPVIATLEALAELPPGSVVRERADERLPGIFERTDDGRDEWWQTDRQGRYTSDDIRLPATLLFRGADA